MKDFLILTAATAIGGFIALIVWTLIVKQQVQAQVATASSNPTLGLLAKLAGA